MADGYTINTNGEEALAAGTKETLVQMRGVTTARAKLTAWGISFDGISPTDPPVVVTLERQSTDGTATAATKSRDDTAAPSASLIGGFRTFTAQPTSGNIIETYEVHPQGGMLIREYPLGREKILAAATTDRLAVTATVPSGSTAVNCVAWMHWEE